MIRVYLKLGAQGNKIILYRVKPPRRPLPILFGRDKNSLWLAKFESVNTLSIVFNCVNMYKEKSAGKEINFILPF